MISSHNQTTRMRKLLMTACLGMFGMAAQAQTGAVEFYKSSLLTTTANLFFAGNNASASSCVTTAGVTPLYPLTTSPSVITGSLASPAMANMTQAYVDVLISGVHYTTMLNLCSLVPGTGYVATFLPSSFTCHYNVIDATPTLVRLYFYP